MTRRGIADSDAPWPGGRLLAEAIDRRAALSGTAVDLGCGGGVVGLAALRKGCFVTFQDSDAARADIARREALKTGAQAARNFDILVGPWRQTPPLRFDNILAGDVTWSEQQNTELAEWVSRCWTRQGPCLFSCSHRKSLRAFAPMLPTEVRISFSVLEDDIYAVDLLEITA